MAKFKVTAPDGKSYAIEAPDQETAAREADAFFAQSKPDLGVTGTVGDTLIGAGSGITDAALATGELPANMASGARWLANKAGMSQEGINQGASAVKSLPMVGPMLQASQGLRNEMDNPTTGAGKALADYRGYQPETTVGKYAKTTGQFAGGLLGPKAGLLTRAGKYVLAPGLGAETLSQAVEGTGYEPYAKAAGGLLGLGGGALALNRFGEKAFRKGMQSADDVEKLGSAAFNEAKKSGIYLKRDTFTDMARDLDDHLADVNGIAWVPGATPKATAVFDHLNKTVLKDTRGIGWAGAPQTQPRISGQLSLNEANTLIKVLGKKAKSLPFTEKEDAKVLWAAKHFLEDRLKQLKVADVWHGGGGNLKRTISTLGRAKTYWTKKSKLDLLDQMEDNADLTAKARFTRGGQEHATRNEFLKFLKKDSNKRQTLTKDELDAFKRVSLGTGVGNAARNFSKQVAGYMGGGGFGAGALLGGFAGGGPIGLLAGGTLGLTVTQLAKMLARRATARAANDARGIIAGDGKMPTRGYISNLSRLLTGNQIVND